MFKNYAQDKCKHRDIIYYTIPLLKGIISTITRYNAEAIPMVELRHTFGEKNATKTGKGGLRGMTLSPELVTEWIDSFPIAVYLTDAMEHMYFEEAQTKHKEEC